MAALNITQSSTAAPTVQQIQKDRITQLAEKYWAPHTIEKHLEFDSNVVEDIYMQDIRGSNFSIRRIMVLEFSQYLENFLWPNYKPGASLAHIMSIVIMVNEKFRERVQVWQAFRKQSEHFPDFFQRVLQACLEDELLINIREQTALLVFLNHCFNSMEEAICRDQVKRLVSLSMWISLQPNRREYEFKMNPKWKKYWRAIQRKDKPEQLEKLSWERTFLHKLMLKFMSVLDSIGQQGVCPPEKVHYCERFLELLIDLEALLPTRRFFNTVLDDCHLVVICWLSGLIKRSEGHLFSQLPITQDELLVPHDPGSWPIHITDSIIQILVQRGPEKVSIIEFPVNKNGRRFTVNNYRRRIPNGKDIPRVWLIYSVSKDVIFYFCCSLFIQFGHL